MRDLQYICGNFWVTRNTNLLIYLYTTLLLISGVGANRYKKIKKSCPILYSNSLSEIKDEMWFITNFCLVICYFTSCYILTFNIQIYDGVWYHDNISYILNIYNTFRCRYLHLLLHFMLHPDIQCSDLWWCMIIMIYHMLLHFMLHPDL